MQSGNHPNKMFYEEDSDLMVKLRPFVTGDRLNIPLSNVISRKWSKVVDPVTSEVDQSNYFLDQYLEGANAFVLLIIADVMHNLKLSVSFEVFKSETGFDPFDSANNDWATGEINRLRCAAGGEEVSALVQPLVWSLTATHIRMPKTSRDYIQEIWDVLDINPNILMLGMIQTENRELVPPPSEDIQRESREARRSTTPKMKIPLYKRVSSVDILGGCDGD